MEAREAYVQGQRADSCCSKDLIPNFPSQPPRPSLQTPQPCQTEDVGRSSWARLQLGQVTAPFKEIQLGGLAIRSCSDISANKASVFPGREVTPAHPQARSGASVHTACLAGGNRQAASLLWAWSNQDGF